MKEFSYLLDKIKNAKFCNHPFRHIYIETFFSDEDFDEIISSKEIAVPEVENDLNLIDSLENVGFQIINFPGCITDKDDYLEWHRHKIKDNRNQTCEGFGMTMRLINSSNAILSEITDFINGDEFNKCIAEKLNLSLEQTYVDSGIQKYLDGYEISPHPDIRKKASTFMVNINPSELSESSNHHTHYMTFIEKRKYVEAFWSGNPEIERCWVPWEWCKSEKVQTRNNSIVIFSPSDDTLHAVKADYNHLITQRTQLYGNIWYNESKCSSECEWNDLDIFSRFANQESQEQKIPKRKFIDKAKLFFQ